MSCCIYDWEKSVYIDISKKLTDNETIDFDIKENGYLLKNGCKALGMPPMSLVVLKWILKGYSYTRLKDNLELRPELNKMLVLYNEYDVCYSTPKEDGKLTIISREEFDDMINGNPKTITTMTDKERLIEFLRENITEDEIGSAWETIAEWRCPLSMADDALYHQIEDLVREFADDNDLGEDFVDLMDIEDLFEQL